MDSIAIDIAHSTIILHCMVGVSERMDKNYIGQYTGTITGFHFSSDRKNKNGDFNERKLRELAKVMVNDSIAWKYYIKSTSQHKAFVGFSIICLASIVGIATAYANNSPPGFKSGLGTLIGVSFVAGLLSQGASSGNLAKAVDIYNEHVLIE